MSYNLQKACSRTTILPFRVCIIYEIMKGFSQPDVMPLSEVVDFWKQTTFIESDVIKTNSTKPQSR
jgi:hypothetical protein